MTTLNEEADPTHEQLWRIQEVATFLDVPASAVYRARKLHGLPTVKIGGTMRFKPASIRAWAAELESTDGSAVTEDRSLQRSERHPVQLLQ